MFDEKWGEHIDFMVDVFCVIRILVCICDYISAAVCAHSQMIRNDKPNEAAKNRLPSKNRKSVWQYMVCQYHTNTHTQTRTQFGLEFRKVILRVLIICMSFLACK